MVVALPSAPLSAHPGGLNKEGCHNNRQTGGYHCHRKASAPAPQRAIPNTGTQRSFKNCSEARAAGAAPVRRGDPGYGPHLDRDNDGIGCE
ncbi:excalibur calcium-binding domain-containing protein [Sphingomicrobium marinum]|uniref:excalibur calcium-binding domain-containing protein n=1 Tax=Sphingomicrobium marinum TaxID=1227950 RepID=UPI00223F57BD|nr:excalibur calcium-binding domain-containing protein [Sphingomicrobium marinum]